MPRLLPLLLTAPLLVAAPVPDAVTHAKAFKKTFGAARTTDGGAFNFDGTALTANLTAERVGSEFHPLAGVHTERAVTGDFELTVTVRTTAPAVPPKVRGKRCDLGGGLAVWEPDPKDERKAAPGDDGREKAVSVCRYYRECGEGTWDRGHFANYPGMVADGSSENGDPSETTHLRITRTGGVLVAAVSTDGDKWTTLLDKPPPVPLPETVSVGVWAFNGTGQKCDVIFEKFTLTPLK